MIQKLLAAALLSTVSYVSCAQGYVPDTSFGNNGVSNTLFNTDSYDVAFDGLQTADGKIIMAGSTSTGNTVYFAVACYLPTGELDTTFGDQGKVILFTGGPHHPDENAKALRIQQDGKIVVAGEKNSKVVIVRLNANGSLDNTFGNNGFTETQIGTAGYVEDLAIQSDGAIIVAANYQSDSFADQKIALLRFTSAGLPDNSFDGDGLFTLSIGTHLDNIFAVKIQPDNKIVACGSKSNAIQDYEFLAIRLNPDGSLDNTFDGDGWTTVSFVTGNSREQAKCLEILPDGKILLGGNTSGFSPSGAFALTRLNPNGTIDTTFGTSGKAYTTLMSATENARSMVVATDGSIFLGGNSSYQTTYNTKIIKYNSSGIRVNTFGGNNNGIKIMSTSTPNTSYFMFMDTDGKLALGGVENASFAINYFNADGSFDHLFDSPAMGNGGGYAYDIRQLPDGSYITSGVIVNGAQKNGVAKFTAIGQLDTTFGNNGVFAVYAGSSVINYQVLQPDGKIITGNQARIFRLNPDGTLDSTFGVGGVQDFSTMVFRFRDIKLQPDGKIVLTGYYLESQTSIYKMFTMRLKSDGFADPTFGSLGVAQGISIDGSSGNSVELQNDGKIVVCGAYPDITDNVPFVARYLANGTPDMSFGTNGVASLTIVTELLSGSDCRDVVVNNDGKIIIGGMTTGPSGYIARLNADGTVDDGYGTNGVVVNPDFQIMSSIILTPDNKTIHGGNIIMCYDDNGNPVPGFATGGYLEVEGNPEFQTVMGMCLQSDGKLAVANFSSEGFIIARYTANDLGTINFNPQNPMYIYPNPVENETHFAYTLAQDKTITIQLFDMQGKLVKTYLDDQLQLAGDYDQPIVMPDNLMSGNYLLRISSSNGSNTVKLFKK